MDLLIEQLASKEKVKISLVEMEILSSKEQQNYLLSIKLVNELGT